jgi:predicted DNA-binding transcriptional regulator AlpA
MSRNATTKEKAMLTRAQLAARYNRDQRTIDRWLRDPKLNFPRPRVIGTRSLLWDENEIDQWQQSRPIKQIPVKRMLSLEDLIIEVDVA